MDPILDRRDDREERVRVRLAVELGQGDFRDAFEADALNVSKGGISVRAACLPDLHSRLLCRFQCAPGGATVTALGEVVWAHLDGNNTGEFGLAFVDLDPKTEWLIEEMIAEHAAQREGRGPSSDRGAKVATLELEGSPEPIAARVARHDGGRAVFEQALDLLSLGRGVLAHAEGWQDRAGSISGVELRMVGSVPMLAVTVSFDGKSENEHDTEPDLKAPPDGVITEAPKGAFGVTVAEFGATRAEIEIANEPGPPPAWAMSPLDHAPSEPEPESEPVSASDSDPHSESGSESVSARKLELADSGAAHDREFSRSFKLEAPGDEPPPVSMLDDDGELDDELEAFAGPSYKPVFAAAWRAFKSGVSGLFGTLGAASASSSRAALPKVRGAFLRSGKKLGSLYGREVGLRVGAARRMVGAALPARKRRTTSGPAGSKRKASGGSLKRTLVLGVFGAAAAGLAVYALAPAPHDDALALQRKTQPLPVPEELPASDEGADSKPVPVATAPAIAPKPTVEAKAEPAREPPRAPSALPSQERVPSSSPFAVDVRSTGQAQSANQAQKGEPTRGKLRFGAAQVPKGRRFALRMSAKVQSLEGVPDKGGFTLTVPGALSLDRAGPISSALKSVKRAMVVNKGDHAELSIRFADGKQPAYQVTAEGTTLYLVIEDTP